jgi:hypothetical protein
MPIRTLFRLAAIVALVVCAASFTASCSYAADNDPPSRILVVGDADATKYYSGDEKFSGLKITVEHHVKSPDGKLVSLYTPEQLRQKVKRGEYQAILLIPPDFSEQLAKYRQQLKDQVAGRAVPGSKPPEVPPPQILYDTKQEKSTDAQSRLNKVVEQWAQDAGRQALRESQLPENSAALGSKAAEAKPADVKPSEAKPSGDGKKAASSSKKKSKHAGARPNVSALLNPPVNTSMFGLPARGNSFVYVCDSSGSMSQPKGRPMAAAKKELLTSLANLEKMQQFQIIFYNNRPKPFSIPGATTRPIFATDDNKKLAEGFVAGIKPDLGTDHVPALSMAVQMTPDVIYFLTDGDDPALSQEELDRISRLNTAASAINVIQFGHSKPNGTNWLMRLARESNGQYKFVDVDELPAQ